jgi:hypothetical protein
MAVFMELMLATSPTFSGRYDRTVPTETRLFPSTLIASIRSADVLDCAKTVEKGDKLPMVNIIKNSTAHSRINLLPVILSNPTIDSYRLL